MEARYVYKGPIDCTTEVDKSLVQGKTVIITGGMYNPTKSFSFQLSCVISTCPPPQASSNSTSGANGIGAEYANAMASAGYD
jgi:hypothetical protein